MEQKRLFREKLVVASVFILAIQSKQASESVSDKEIVIESNGESGFIENELIVFKLKPFEVDRFTEIFDLARIPHAISELRE